MVTLVSADNPGPRRNSNPARRYSTRHGLEHLGIRFVSDLDDGLAPIPSPIAELAADPEAARWARDCAWVPGTGHCRNRPCSAACLFRPQRVAEARRVLRWRRRRRQIQSALAGRTAAPRSCPE
jgi:hypothetical protein